MKEKEWEDGREGFWRGAVVQRKERGWEGRRSKEGGRVVGVLTFTRV